jgi:hypothetical protein
VRLTKLDEPLPEGEAPTLPADGVSMEVEATLSEDGSGAEFVTPVFEGMEEGFDCVVQLANDGQVWGPGLVLFKYEAAAVKGKKK